jgi:hypothetical protein
MAGSCPPGYYCLFPSWTQFACPAGTWQPLSARSSPSSCLNCTVAGQYCPIASFVIATCAAGFYCNTTAFQIICPGGSYCPASATSPIPCPAGFNLQSTGNRALSNCTICAPASYNPSAGLSTRCPSCPVGTFGPPGVSGLTMCLNCAPGFYNPTTSAFACTACLEGTFLSNTGSILASSCQPCPAGTFNNSKGASFCTVCPAGTYCPIQVRASKHNCFADPPCL